MVALSATWPAMALQGHTAQPEENVPALETYFGWLGSPGFLDAFAVGPDGSIYVTTPVNGTSGAVIYRVDPDGILRRFAGGGTNKQDGGAALDWLFDRTTTHPPAAGPDGSVYVFDTVGGAGSDHVLRRITPDGIVHTIAGGGSNERIEADGGPATDVKINFCEQR